VDFSGRSTQDLLAELEQRKREEVEEAGRDSDDPISRWLTTDEYSKLSSAERSDLALKRWRESRKSNWQIGREYERSVGFELESNGFSIEYVGALKGYEDMGRDLIATRGSTKYLVQCKYWSVEKRIHEKHVFQLIGTALEYACRELDRPIARLDLTGVGIFPMLVTSTSLSDVARRCAKHVNVEVREQRQLRPYPQVKCNINGRTNERIYHLPFDQHYDSTRIDTGKGECYVGTAAEAEQRGFRRARRHFPNGRC
jgi:hypothetical protein